MTEITKDTLIGDILDADRGTETCISQQLVEHGL